jgi:hypothetical protein
MEPTHRNIRDYSKTELVFGNLTIILWISLGAVSCALFNLWVGLGFFILSAFLIFYELGKHGCVTCYFCKTCTIGMGKLPDLFFKQGGTANVNQRALKLFPFVYALLTVVPVVLVVFSVVEEFVVFKLALLAGLLAFSVYVGVARRKTLIG